MHEDLYEQIEKRREQLETELAALREERDTNVKRLNAEIKTREVALSKLPRKPKTINRPKKQAEQFVGDRDITSREESRGIG